MVHTVPYMHKNKLIRLSVSFPKAIIMTNLRGGETAVSPKINPAALSNYYLGICPRLGLLMGFAASKPVDIRAGNGRFPQNQRHRLVQLLFGQLPATGLADGVCRLKTRRYSDGKRPFGDSFGGRMMGKRPFFARKTAAGKGGAYGHSTC